jgi:hypothetical protein
VQSAKRGNAFAGEEEALELPIFQSCWGEETSTSGVCAESGGRKQGTRDAAVATHCIWQTTSYLHPSTDDLHSEVKY